MLQLGTPNLCLPCNIAAKRKTSSENWKASSKNQKVSSEDAEGFFRRALALYAHKFPKKGAASLTDIPEFV